MHTPRVALIATSLVATTAFLIAGCGEGASEAHAASSSGSRNATTKAPAPQAFPSEPDKVAEHVLRSIGEGKLYVAWDALPQSYQADVTQLVHTFAANVDRDLWNRGFEVFGKVITVMETKKDLILAMPKFQEAPGFDLQKASREWDSVIAPFKTIAKSDIANVDRMKNVDIRKMLGTTGVDFIKQLEALNEIKEGGPANDLANMRQAHATFVGFLGNSKDNAMVTLEVPGKPTIDQEFVKVEGKWIPLDVQQDWDKQMAEAREALSKMSGAKFAEKKPQIMQMLDAVDGTLDQLMAATTPEQFEQTVKMGVFQVFGGLMALGQDN
ncbi:MAG: hypothetical protein KDA20_02915 [Phycisphaerales bacterium]|nr:hypothetical protein [Phycisphaerales bacterium]